jgi:hypothetical protein
VREAGAQGNHCTATVFWSIVRSLLLNAATSSVDTSDKVQSFTLRNLINVQICLLGCTAVYNNCRPTFQRYVLPPSSGRWVIMIHRPDDGGSTYLRNVDRQLFYTAVHPRIQIWTSFSPPWKLEISLITVAWFHKNVYLSKEIWIQLKPHTHKRCTRLFLLSYGTCHKYGCQLNRVPFDDILHF